MLALFSLILILPHAVMHLMTAMNYDHTNLFHISSIHAMSATALNIAHVGVLSAMIHSGGKFEITEIFDEDGAKRVKRLSLAALVVDLIAAVFDVICICIFVVLIWPSTNINVYLMIQIAAFTLCKVPSVVLTCVRFHKLRMNTFWSGNYQVTE